MTNGVNDPALTTRELADWLGTSTEYVRLELVNGKMPFENISRVPFRKDYRVRFSDFVEYCRSAGRNRLPSLDDFHAAN